MLDSPLALALLGTTATVMVLYAASMLFWGFEVGVLARGWQQAAADRPFGPEDVQVRIMTVDAEEVVQDTVDTLGGGFDEIRVIAEDDIDVLGARVHVVPADFDCRATHKGRALEWARRELPSDHDFVLYLDEDTHIASFGGLPDADVVQFTELPRRTGSWLAYLSEVYRIGYQIEQRAFDRFRFPLYAWGGGIAIRPELEHRVTWDAESITEDTDFVWRAASEAPLDFRVLNAKFRNQAPPSLWSMIVQRRRWMSGTREDTDLLSPLYRLLVRTRVITWGFASAIPLLTAGIFLVPAPLPYDRVFEIAGIGLFATQFVVTAAGAREYWPNERIALLAIPLTPVLVVLNTVGALWGFLSPVQEFAVTEKVEDTE